MEDKYDINKYTLFLDMWECQAWVGEYQKVWFIDTEVFPP